MSANDEWQKALQEVVARAEKNGHFDRMAEAARGQQTQSDRERAARSVRALTARGVPPRIAREIGRALARTVAMGAAAKFVNAHATGEAPMILTLAGRTGSGKSLAAAWAVSRISGARFAHVRELSRATSYSAEAMAPFEECAVLALDDLGTEYADRNEMYLHVIDNVISARHASALPTIVTTNLTEDDIHARYGDRISSRMQDGEFVYCPEQDMRGDR